MANRAPNCPKFEMTLRHCFVKTCELPEKKNQKSIYFSANYCLT